MPHSAFVSGVSLSGASESVLPHSSVMVSSDVQHGKTVIGRPLTVVALNSVHNFVKRTAVVFETSDALWKAFKVLTGMTQLFDV